MSENGGARNVEFCECLLDQFGLGFWGPDHIARAIAVTEPGSVENDDPEMFRRKINQTAGIKVFSIMLPLPCNRTKGSPEPRST